MFTLDASFEVARTGCDASVCARRPASRLESAPIAAGAAVPVVSKSRCRCSVTAPPRFFLLFSGFSETTFGAVPESPTGSWFGVSRLVSDGAVGFFVGLVRIFGTAPGGWTSLADECSLKVATWDSFRSFTTSMPFSSSSTGWATLFSFDHPRSSFLIPKQVTPLECMTYNSKSIGSSSSSADRVGSPEEGNNSTLRSSPRFANEYSRSPLKIAVASALGKVESLLANRCTNLACDIAGRLYFGAERWSR